MDEIHFTYILASKCRGALFVGATDDLEGCVREHRLNQVEGLTSLYAIHQLVYYEFFDKAGPALLRERDIKRLPRCRKLHLIESVNPYWRDLYSEIELAAMSPA
jgi:putative endonuclease